jgi:ABC-2 type transport system permease protein
MNTASYLRRQTFLELLALRRDPQSFFLTAALPVSLLLIIGYADGDQHLNGQALRALLVPGIVAFAIVMTAYVNIVTRLATLRLDGVLRRIQVTPLPRWVYLVAHLIASWIVVAVVVVGTVILGSWLLNTEPAVGSLGTLALVVSLGAISASAAGLAVSTLVPSPAATTPVANTTALPLLLLAGAFFPLPPLPHWADTISSALPVQPLITLLKQTYSGTNLSVGAVAVLLAWAIGATLVALRRLRWSDAA